MKLEEQDYEAAIIQKLDDMKDLVKSLVASLEEPPEKKEERLVPVYPSVAGKIHKWYFSTGNYVGRGDLLCEIDANVDELDRKLPDLHPVRSPATGILLIGSLYRDKEDRVRSTGTPIAHIKT